jgi:hypothetical protein
MTDVIKIADNMDIDCDKNDEYQILKNITKQN